MPDATGRFWLCPECHKHVPARTDACRCGFDRTSVPVRMREISTRDSSDASPAPGGLRLSTVLGGVATVVACGGLLYLGILGWSQPSASSSAPKRRFVFGPREPQVVVVQAPPAAMTREAPRDWLATVKPDALDGLQAKDREAALKIAESLSNGTEVSTTDIVRAETLVRTYPKDAAVGLLLRSLLLVGADQRRSHGDFDQARAYLDRAATLFPDDSEIRRSRLDLVLEVHDWPSVESLSRQALEREPASPTARSALALALAARGQDREALRAIYAALEVAGHTGEEPKLRELRDQIERRLWVTGGCDLSQLQDPSRAGDANQRLEKFLALLSGCAGGSVGQRVAHFSVGYRRTGDDEVFAKLRVVSVESASRDVLRLLETQYSTLAATLSHEMTRTIPVVILSDVEFHFSTGAPSWSGGQFDSQDGTITIPLGFFARLQFDDPEPERQWERQKEVWLGTLLIHEAAHAFIEDISRGVAPHGEFNEGLARYLEREVTRERTALSTRIEEDYDRSAKARYPDNSDAQRNYKVRALSLLFENIRTAGLGHAGTLQSTYVGGELFVEDLVAQRSMGGIQTLLRAMASTRNVDGAFEQVFGQNLDGTRRAWLDRLRLQWGAGSVRRE